MRATPPGQNDIWNSTDEDGRPATVEELRGRNRDAPQKPWQPGRFRYQGASGHPPDRAVLDVFRAIRKGRQTWLNEALKVWLKKYAA